MDKNQPNPNSEIALFVKTVRDTLGKTQDDFAYIYNCTKGNVSAWENGRHEPPYAILADMSARTGVVLPLSVKLEFLNEPVIDRYAHERTASHKAQADKYIKFELLDVQAAAGNTIPSAESREVVQQIHVLSSWAQTALGSDLSRIKIISSCGTSMQGTIENGDVLFVDATVRTYDGDGIYVIARSGDVQVKRLQKLHGGVLAIISDNRAYESERLSKEDADAVVICGRVLAAWSLKKFW